MNMLMVVACLSLATKLSEHSNHWSLSLFQSDTLMVSVFCVRRKECNDVDVLVG